MATRVGRGKIQLAQHFRKLPHRCKKNLAHIFYTSRLIASFVPNFVVMATGVGRGNKRLAAFDGPPTKTSLYAQKFR